MDKKPRRDLGGKLALLAFWLFCLYALWAILRYFWVVSAVQPIPGDVHGTFSGKLLDVLAGGIVLGGIALVLGAVVWYTRPVDHR